MKNKIILSYLLTSLFVSTNIFAEESRDYFNYNSLSASGISKTYLFDDESEIELTGASINFTGEITNFLYLSSSISRLIPTEQYINTSTEYTNYGVGLGLQADISTGINIGAFYLFSNTEAEFVISNNNDDAKYKDDKGSNLFTYFIKVRPFDFMQITAAKSRLTEDEFIDDFFTAGINLFLHERFALNASRTFEEQTYDGISIDSFTAGVTIYLD